MATPGGVAGLVGWVALRDRLVRITVLVVEQRWVGWFWCVTLFVWPHYNSERRILPDVLNLQLDQRKFIVSEQFIEVGLITNNDGGGGESIVYIV